MVPVFEAYRRLTDTYNNVDNLIDNVVDRTVLALKGRFKGRQKAQEDEVKRLGKDLERIKREMENDPILEILSTEIEAFQNQVRTLNRTY